MLELKNINKSFSGKQVLYNINAKFEPGKPNLIIGASGGGKSVLLKCMVGLLKPEIGNVLYDGRDFVNLEYDKVKEIRQEIGMLFQGTALFDSLTVAQNVEFPLKMFSKMSKAEMKDRVDFCLERVQLEGAGDKYPAEISGGMKKRVGIARAISMNIRYLFCDEPNSGLDPITSRVIDNLLLDITAEYNITTMIISHDMKTAFDIGDKILFLYNGKIRWNGSKDDIHSAGKEIEELGEFINSSQV
jgi:phospholipid/cholesterol/gamma-HCH transport system ATP-binding protein